MLPDMPGTAPYNRTLARLRLVAVYLFLVALVLFARPTPLSVSFGFVFVAGGEALRLWAAGHLYKNVQLVTSGPYRYTRNPLYLGRLLVFTGVCLMARLPFGTSLIVIAIGFLLFFGYYLPRKERVECARLREIHGERYEHYERSVPALFPSLSAYPERGSTGWSSLRMTRNREHWMLVGLIVVTASLLWIAYFAPDGLLASWMDGS
jgi:protein-S-isoprenylcysteine O-methyltransferase Ste14